MTAPELLGAARLRQICARHGITPKKSLGQNFVIDPNTIRKVIEVARVGPDDVVVEIGAGAGSLTLGLAGRARKVVAVEIDHRLVPLLDELLGEVANVEVRYEDAQALDWSSIGATKLVANLPYNIAVTLVLDALEHAAGIDQMAVMTQREAGERLAAAPGSKTYGISSVIAQLFADVEIAAPVSRNAFWPVPNVDSVLVVLHRRSDPPDVDVRAFKSVVNAAFGQRRKMARNTLATVTSDAEGLLRRAGLEPTVRAEEIPVDAYVAMARAL